MLKTRERRFGSIGVRPTWFLIVGNEGDGSILNDNLDKALFFVK